MRASTCGTALLMVALGAAYGLGLTVLQVIERASGGWGYRSPAALALAMGLGGLSTIRWVTI